MTIAEDPTGHLSTFSPLVFELCELEEDGVVRTGQFVVPPLELWPAGDTVEPSAHNHFVGWMEYVMNYAEMVIRREASEVGFHREGFGVPPACVFEDTRSWIHGHEVGQRAEVTQGG